MKNTIRKSLLASILTGAAYLLIGSASAETISTSGACPGDGTCDGTVSGTYSYLFEATTDGVASSQIKVTLTNTTTSPDQTLIDAFFFNLALNAGDDVYFSNISSGWAVGDCSTPASCQFEYRGDAASNTDRLSNGQSMSFIVNFIDGTENPIDAYLAALTDAGGSMGTGIGGGSDEGKLCVSFQQINTADNTLPDGSENDSDLICGSMPPKLPEPGTLGLLGIGLLGMGLARRRRLG